MLVILYVETVPNHLRGYLDRYLNEIRSSLFIGSLTSSVAEQLWSTYSEAAGQGDAVMITPDSTEAGFLIRHRARPDWKIRDYQGWPLPTRRRNANETESAEAIIPGE